MSDTDIPAIGHIYSVIVPECPVEYVKIGESEILAGIE